MPKPSGAKSEQVKLPTRERMVKSTGEPFDTFMRRVLSVPKKELDRKQTAYERSKKKRRG